LAIAFSGGWCRAAILVTQLPVGSAAERQAPAAGGTLRTDYGQGARIVLLPDTGAPRVLTQDFHSACEADVSFDGKRFLFAGKRAAQDPWNIYEMAVDGSGVRQITRGLGDCHSPGYQSTQYVITAADAWYQITFVGAGHGGLNEIADVAAASLYSCKLDGTEVRRLTYNLSSDYDPAIAGDGRLLYASWQRATLDHGLLGRIRLFGVNTDGTDCASLLGYAGKRVQHMPCTTPGGLAVFVEADRVPWDGAGSLACVELRRPLHTYRFLTKPDDGLFHSPSPLPDGRVLVSRRPADGSGTHGVYRFEPWSKRWEPVYDDPRVHDLQAKGVFAREEPDGRSSVVSQQDPHGKFYCLSAFQSDLKAPQWGPQVVRRLRVLEGLPRRPTGPANSQAAEEKPTTGVPGLDRGTPQLALRRLLGEVPLEKDGSFNIEVPANTPIQLQLLDERGMALRSCGWIWTRSHQSQGCIGCHEDGELSPNNGTPDSLTGDSRLVFPPVEERRAVDFRRDLAPLVVAKCAGCHDRSGSPPTLEAGAGEAAARRNYEALLAFREGATQREPRGKYVEPGRARTSPLAWHVVGQNTSRTWDGPSARGVVKPIPPGKVEPLTDEEKQRLIEWIDFGAAWEGPAR
jgi:hypothetical protein